MLLRLNKYLSDIPAIVIDGALYTALAMVLFLQNQFASDEAGKFISLEWLFYIKTVVGVFAAGLLAVKLFRSTAFAEHKQQKKADDTGEVQTIETKPTVKTGHTGFLAKEKVKLP